MNGKYDIGDYVLSNWKLVKLLGQGAYGKVYEAQKEEWGQYKAAIKIITIPQSVSEIQSARSEGMTIEQVNDYFKYVVQQIINECAFMSRMKGVTNIVSYEDHVVIPHDDQLGWDIIIRMELLEPLLGHVIEHPMTQEDTAKLGIDICKALEMCQKLNILHRDIKPENIMISEFGDYKLGDFGISRTIEKTQGGLSKKGTVSYMAPEVIKGEAYGLTVDVYSLGIVLYRFLNDNRGPFLPAPPAPVLFSDRENALERRIRGESLPKPAHADDELVRIVLKSCAYEPRDRYQTPEQMRRDLEAWLNSDHVDEAVPYIEQEEQTLTESVFHDSTKESESEKASRTMPLENVTNDIPAGEIVAEVEDDERTVSVHSAMQSRKITEKTKKNTWRTIGIVAVLFILIGGGIIWGVILRDDKTKDSDQETIEKQVPNRVVSIPDLIDYDQNTAISMLQRLGIRYKVVEKEDASFAGMVLELEPKAGEVVSSDTVVTIYISKGSADLGNLDGTNKMIEIENLVGKSYDTAKAELKNQGITLGKSGQEHSLDYAAGVIISQDVAPGTMLPQGSGVLTVVVSRGDTNSIPSDLLGHNQAEVESVLKNEGFQNIQVTTKQNKADKGTVIEIAPKEGSDWKIGEAVVLIVSEGPTAQWSEWVEILPSNVSAADYSIEQKTQYSYRDKSYTESSDANLGSQGYKFESQTPIYSDYGGWSEWTTETITGTDLIQVDNETRYSYRDLTVTNNYYWGDWTDWQNEAVTNTKTRQVETREIPANYKTQYNYSRYVEYADGKGYKESTPGWWNGHYCQYEQRKSLDSPLPIEKVRQYADGTSFNQYSDSDGEWYNEGTSQVEVTPAYTQYRYCDQKNSKTESWGDWTEYSPTAVSPSDTRDVRTQVYYRSRTRTLSYKYNYSMWSEWSNYSDQAVTKTDTRDVRTKVLYRYKAK